MSNPQTVLRGIKKQISDLQTKIQPEPETDHIQQFWDLVFDEYHKYYGYNGDLSRHEHLWIEAQREKNPKAFKWYYTDHEWGLLAQEQLRFILHDRVAVHEEVRIEVNAELERLGNPHRVPSPAST